MPEWTIKATLLFAAMDAFAAKHDLPDPPPPPPRRPPKDAAWFERRLREEGLGDDFGVVGWAQALAEQVAKPLQDDINHEEAMICAETRFPELPSLMLEELMKELGQLASSEAQPHR